MALTKTEIQEAIKNEISRCSTDIPYFFKKYGIVQHPVRGKVPFDLYPFQESTVTQFEKNRFHIILKARQMGISTLVAAYCLWCMIFKPDFKILVIAVTQDVAQNLITKVKLFYSNIPSWLKPNKVDDNKSSLSLENGSLIKAVSSAGTSGRSEASSLLVIDEFAFIDKIDELWASSQMTLAEGGSAILLSTPNGTGNLFHRIFQKAEEGSTEGNLGSFNPIRLKWDLHPTRDQAWRDLQTEQLGPRLASQECDCSFLASGHTFIDPGIISWYEEESGYIQDPIEKRGPGGDYWIWKYPEPGKSYAVIVDTATGHGDDYSTISVYDVESCELVAELKSKIGPVDLGNFSIVVATEYNDALLAIENNSIGFATIQPALDRNYQNLLYTFKNDAFLDQNIQVKKKYDLKPKEDMVPGFFLSSKLRPNILSKLEFYMIEKSLINRSKRFYSEIRTFIWMNGKPQAQRGYNDDLIIPASIFLYLRDNLLKLRNLGIAMDRASVKSIRGPQISQASKRLNNPWILNTGQSQEDLTWLLK